ncbi:FAD-dependent oxidoreductase [Natranaerofaba carboxydovora]|uniref:FAD-dependent oxidoreductase n=1 Tax=Natranaerofaba carboxydovora TaxID=2742683 RepID=UPI001F149526|nr:FAD-dependent oxidoreductase [Natranaerofaba carboxydovora]UMZ74155.1 NADPH-Fe(3+) oxidoreductase subunit beta [Natranaerofaba carboxydovora]
MTKSHIEVFEGFPGKPPCEYGCPISQEVREYLRFIATGNFDEALETIMRTNPVSSVCGTICAHHCEDECRRQNVDEPLSIRGLKRAAIAYGDGEYPQPKENKGKKAAVIGSGPAGLLAAFDLTMEGYSVTIFERQERLGGAPRNYIPLYRLPDETIDRDIENLKKIGVEFKTGVEFGTDIKVEDLKNDGYEAIVLALGLANSRGLPLPGADNENVIMALDFLKATKRENYRVEGKEVIVIGGGNVAMDVARTAVRSGAKKVKLACLESYDEMPAFSWEIEEAEEEGVELNCSWGPDRIVVEGDKVTGLEAKECACVFDDSGNFNPQFCEDNKKTITGDMVIFSIGQGPDLEAVKEAGLPVDERGRLVVDHSTLKTPVEGVFACGEIATGPTTAVRAMSNARVAAQAVKSYLEGETFVSEMVEEEEPLPQLEDDVKENIVEIKRNEIPMLSPEERCDNFKPIEKGYSLETAVWEGRRCLGCAAGAERIVENCVKCLTCMRTCPYDVPKIDEEGNMIIRDYQCQACGLCLTVCPNIAIEFRSTYIEEAEEQIEPTVQKINASKSGDEPSILVYSCAYGAYALPEFKDKFMNGKPANIGVVRFPCISKIDSTHILEGFQSGVDGIIIAGCEEDTESNEEKVCPFIQTTYWAEKRVGYIKSILNEVGIEEERVECLTLTADQVSNFNESIKETVNRMKDLGKALS